MKQLSMLSPAETLLVLEGRNASLKELLKVTFMDLLLKQVLKTIEVDRQPHPHDPVTTFTYVVTGNNYLNYRALRHENVFLAPFHQSDNIQILFRNIVKMGYQNAKSQNYYHTLVAQGPAIATCFTQTIWQRFLGIFPANAQFLQFRRTLQQEVAQLEEQLPSLIHADQNKAWEVLKVIRGNVFLLRNLDLDLMKQLDKQLLEEMDQHERNITAGGCSISYSAWDSFGDYADSFDSSCGGDSGCSGDSSGDGGCSGCGGCGGGGD